MAKRKEYKIAKLLINNGSIKNFRELLEFIPKKPLAQDLGIHWITLGRRLKEIGNLSLENLMLLAIMIDVDLMTIVHLAAQQYDQDQKARKKDQ